MSIEYVTQATNNSGGSASLTVTIPSAGISGTNHFVLVGFGFPSGTSLDVFKVNTVSATQFAGSRYDPSWKFWAGWYKAENLSGGDITVDATFGQTGTFYGAAMLYSGVDQTTPFTGLVYALSSANDAPTTAGASPAGAIVSADATDLLVDLMMSGSASDPTVTDSGATRNYFTPTASVPRFACASKAGGADRTPTWTITDGFHGWVDLGFALKAAADVGTTISPNTAGMSV